MRWTLIFLLLLLPSTTLAASQAAIVVKKSSGEVIQKCISFDSIITGWQALKLAGLSPEADQGFMVEIAGDRAKTYSHPDSKNDYWSYWQNNNSSWQYAKIGAFQSKVTNGQIEGWQRGSSQPSLPPVSFKSICPPTQTVKTESIQNSENLPEPELEEIEEAESDNQPSEQSPHKTVQNTPAKSSSPSTKETNNTNPSSTNQDSLKNTDDTNIPGSPHETSSAIKSEPETKVASYQAKYIWITPLLAVITFMAALRFKRKMVKHK